MSTQPGIGPQIGASLRDARRRLGLEVKEVEEQTKIRARYIRALENEEWETLPGPAYIRGFLRTYAAMLGLDGEMLADEYRRRHEGAPQPGSPAAEPLLSERPRHGVHPPSRGPLIAMVLIAIFIVLLALGLLGGGDDDDGDPARERSAKEQKQAERKAARQAAKETKQEDPREVTEGTLTALTGVEVCLVAGNAALIDNQLLSEGAEEPFSGEKVYRVDVSGGGVLFEVGGDRERVETTESISLEGDSRGIRTVEPSGDCP